MPCHSLQLRGFQVLGKTLRTVRPLATLSKCVDLQYTAPAVYPKDTLGVMFWLFIASRKLGVFLSSTVKLADAAPSPKLPSQTSAVATPATVREAKSTLFPDVPLLIETVSRP